MAKQKPPSEPADYIVTLNGHETEPVTVNAISPEEAINKVIAETESQRDRRNYTAVLKTRAQQIESGSRPPIKTK